MIVLGIKHVTYFWVIVMKDVLDAYAQRDVERALDVWERDADLDAWAYSAFCGLLTHMMEDRGTSPSAPIFCSARRTSSGSAMTPGRSPRLWSIR